MRAPTAQWSAAWHCQQVQLQLLVAAGGRSAPTLAMASLAQRFCACERLMHRYCASSAAFNTPCACFVH